MSTTKPSKRRPSRGATLLRKRVTPPADTQVGIAEKCDVSAQAVGKWIAMLSKPDLEHRKLLEEITDGEIPASAWDEEESEEPLARVG